MNSKQRKILFRLAPKRKKTKLFFLFSTILFLFSCLASPSNAGGILEDLPGLPATHAPVNDKVRNSFYFDFGSVSSLSSINSPSYSLYSTGYQLGIGHDFGISPGFSISLDIHYSFHPLNNPAGDAYWNYSTTGGGLHTLMFSANAKFNFNNPDDPVIVYTFTGLGPVQTTLDPETQTLSATNGSYNTSTSYAGISETDFGIRFGIGADFRLNSFLALFAETSLTDIFVSNQIKYGTLPQYRLSGGLKVKY